MIRWRNLLRGEPVRRSCVLAALGVLIYLALAGSAVAKPSEHPFEIVPGSFQIVPSTTQAGAHEDLTTSFDFAHGEDGYPYNDVRNVVVNLPPGVIGNNTAIPTCTPAQLVAIAGEDGAAAQCPLASQVGLISFAVANGKGAGSPPAQFTVPIYNMETTSFGITAELGFKSVILTQILDIGVRPGDSGLTVTTPNIPNLEVRNVSVTIWGLPASHEHDAQRGETCGEAFEVPANCHNEFGGPQEAHVPVKPYLSNSTSCGLFTATMAAYSWEEPLSAPAMASSEIGPIEGCERIPFDPSIEVQPTTNTAESPSGLNVSLVVPQSWETPYSISTANLKDTSLTLPVGYTVNPSAGSGLGVCRPEQLAAETSSSLPGEGCPPESKIGTVDVETPVLAEKLSGAIYVAEPFNNPFGSPEHPGGSLLALYIVVKDPARGIVVKLSGHIEPNLVTGQLVTRFDNNPQVPFSKFTLKLRQGGTSPLVSPPACGSYTAEANLTPWSAPLSPQHIVSPSFAIEQGIGGGACPSGGVPPFKPEIVAGTLNSRAGVYSQMNIRVTRSDGEQEITRFSSQLPPGLTAKLSGVPFCPDADIQLAKEKTGAQEESEPSCPTASQIGHSLVGAGVGSVLAWAPGRVYMAGPYNGAPFSIVAITSAKVGPFDLGTVVVREALKIDPVNAVVTVDATASDPIPHIIDGIVIHVRDIRVYVDRPEFTLNPTNCNPMSFAATVDGAGADFANPADQQPVTVTSPFGLTDCRSLGFKPVFKALTSAKSSRTMGTSLHVTLAYPKAPQGTQANIRSVKVSLPKQLPSRLTTLQKACSDSMFNADPAGCPVASRVGTATAITPIVPVPLSGPVYFVSHGARAFPDLVIVLQGYGITVDLRGETFISKKGITSTTFRTIPDQPVTSFELTLPKGPYSALTNNGNLCEVKGGLKMPTALVAQNGLTIHRSTPIGVSGCPKHKVKKARKSAKHSKHSVRGKKR
jgi:hypothetical protein